MPPQLYQQLNMQEYRPTTNKKILELMASQESQPFLWKYTEIDDHNFQIRCRTLFVIVVLFTAVFLLFLYARCVYRLTHPSNSASNANRAPQPVSLPQGLDPTAINTLPIILHQSKSTSDDKEETECCICLGVFEDGDKVKILPKCQHCYHCECVDTWLSTRSSCPLCRNSLRVDSVLPSIVTQ